MLTKNFYSFVLIKGLKRNIPNSLTTTNGTVRDHSYYYNDTSDWIFNAMSSFNTRDTDYGVRIGTGTTPATVGDYNLEVPITAGVSFNNSSSTVFNMDDDGCSVYATSGVTNTGTETLSVSEIGLFAKLYYASGTMCVAMVDRTVLDEPIVINPGETKQLTYTIRMNYPTA